MTYKAVGGEHKRARRGELIEDKGRGVDFQWLLDDGSLVEEDPNKGAAAPDED